MTLLLSSKLKKELLSFQTIFTDQDAFLVLPVCTMESYVNSESQWEEYFGEKGKLKRKICSELHAVGADEDKMTFYNYFKEGIPEFADYSHIVIPGGDAELGFSRIMKSGLAEELIKFDKTIIAYSAGALILFDQYFLSPNYYYSKFTTHSGLSVVCDHFTIEVHYDNSNTMKKYVHKGMNALKKKVIAIGNDGAISYDTSTKQLDFFGQVKVF